MSKKIIMLRDVTCRITGQGIKTFRQGVRYSADFAGWLPVDSYEYHERKPIVPEPNEILVDYDG